MFPVAGVRNCVISVWYPGFKAGQMMSNHLGSKLGPHDIYFQGRRCPCIVNKYEILSLVDESSFLYIRFSPFLVCLCRGNGATLYCWCIWGWKEKKTEQVTLPKNIKKIEINYMCSHKYIKIIK